MSRTDEQAATLIAIAALLTGEPPKMILHGSQRVHIQARSAIAWTVRRGMALSLSQTGILIGDKCAETVRSSLRLADDLRDFDAGYRALTDLLATAWDYLLEARS